LNIAGSQVADATMRVQVQMAAVHFSTHMGMDPILGVKADSELKCAPTSPPRRKHVLVYLFYLYSTGQGMGICRKLIIPGAVPAWILT
jgi:hypothetical protein